MTSPAKPTEEQQETPRTDAVLAQDYGINTAIYLHRRYDKMVVPANFARQLERELAASTERARWLEEALREVLAAERFSNRLPATTMQAEAKLDRIRAAVEKAEAALRGERRCHAASSPQ